MWEVRGTNLLLLRLLPVTQGTSTNRTLYLVYQGVAPMSLLPCTSASNVSNCAAVAYDDVDGDGAFSAAKGDVDLTASITATEATPCASNASCVRCTVTDGTLGSCLPGNYTTR